MPDDLDSMCFLVAPIGEEGSDTRARSDRVRDHIVRPAVEPLDLALVRADGLPTPGEITPQVIDHVLRAKLVVADLTGSNANVFYELALRHAVRLPCVQIAEVGERLPFDVGTMRTIFVDHRDLQSVAECISQIEQQARAAIDGSVQSPVATAITLQSLQGGDALEAVASDLLAGMEVITRSIEELGTRIDAANMVQRMLALRRLPLYSKIDTEDLASEIARLFSKLDPREREVLVLRFGLDRGEPRTIAEVAEHFGLAPERIRVIERQAMENLRAIDDE